MHKYIIQFNKICKMMKKENMMAKKYLIAMKNHNLGKFKNNDQENGIYVFRTCKKGRSTL